MVPGARLEALEAAHRETRAELATYASETALLRRDVADLRELAEQTLAAVQTTQRQSLQVQRGARRAQTVATMLGPGVLVVVELVRYVLEHLAR